MRELSHDDDDELSDVLVLPRDALHAAGWIIVAAVDAGWIAVAIFFAVLAVIVFATMRGMWRIWRGEPESEAGGSWGRQLFGRRRRKT